MIEKNDSFHDSIFLYKEISPSIGKFTSSAVYRILSFCSKKKFLVLAISQYYQHIFQCTVGSSIEKLIATLPIHKKVVSASLSVDGDKLFVILYSEPNCFSKTQTFTAQCIIPNTELSYPVSVPTKSCPKIECSNNNSKFVFSGDIGRYETYDIQCNETEFSIHLDNKSKSGIYWWNLKQRTYLEYVKYDSSNDKYKFISQKMTFHLPTLPKPLPFEFHYLSSKSNQNVIFFLNQSVFGLILPRSALELRLPYKRILNIKLSTFSALSNDLLFILSPQRTMLFVLIDSFSQPRAAFEIKLHENCQEEFKMLSSFHSFNCIDQRFGNQLSFSFDYENLIKNEPRLFIPFLHHSVLNDGNKSEIMKFLSKDSFQTYWTGSIFDEYFLCLFKSDLQNVLAPRQIEFFNSNITTFCPSSQFSYELGLFSPYQSDYADQQTIPPPMLNWGKVKSNYPDIFHNSFHSNPNSNNNININNNNAESNDDNITNDITNDLNNSNNKGDSIYVHLMKLINSFDLNALHKELHYLTLLNLIALYLRINDSFSYPINFPLKIKETILDTLSECSNEFWEAHNLVLNTGKIQVKRPTFDKNMNNLELQKSWWKVRTMTQITKHSNVPYGVFDAIAEATEEAKEPSAQQDLLAFYKPLFNKKFVLDDV
ncbi:hypothetical protein TRFO_27819 [Tritrichomonas foetus]|uniref:Uncharacterized protein n=1 Tax=Tritrichomonas foetus TaxID=1144522 RepID=A0A1J4K4K8_9EUKA|nr:hypothetical protein TRFO_27819 [Tritrichomonas foetus]|eukprot:OHT04614.1 hypothetical protein TRFO_27819 [Tritrichomonas foetus]